jgi:DNA-binding MurR/RpiR family transcriptional regulator
MSVEKENQEDARNNLGIIVTMRGLYPSLNRAEQSVADYVLENPTLVKQMSITQLAHESGVSETTVVRFCRVLGFSGYTDFKLGLLEEVISSSSNIEVLDTVTDVKLDDDLEVVLKKVFQMNQMALSDTLQMIDVQEMQKAVDVLTNAGRVELFAIGSSAPIATDLYYRFLRCGIPGHYVSDPHIQAVNAALLNNGDAAIAISYSGETTETLRALRIAQDAGAVGICVSNFPKSELAVQADIRLITSSNRTKWIKESVASRIVQLSVFDALCVAVAIKKKEDLGARIVKIDRALEKR